MTAKFCLTFGKTGNIINAMKKCVAYQRKSSLCDKAAHFFCVKMKGRNGNKMAETNKMKDMPVNKLMIQMGVALIWWAFPITEVIACLVEYVFLKRIFERTSYIIL